MGTSQPSYDAIIVGAGVSGSFISCRLTEEGMKCVLLEAGKFFTRETYPRKEIDVNSQLYWAGGIELNDDVSIGFLRPKVVGGGSVVNQALVDRFDEDALGSWREASGVPFFTVDGLTPWYERAESEISIQRIPERYWNRNARIFQQGFQNSGYRCAPLQRAQKDCRYEDGNDCIECLAGCRIDSKQSMPVTVLKKALDGGLEIVPEFEVAHVAPGSGEVTVSGRNREGSAESYRGRLLVLAAGAIGNSTLLLRSGFSRRLPRLGHDFYTHPQYMNLAVYDEPVNSHKGPFQALKSDDPTFRRSGFKLENVFAPPVAIAMLLPGFGKKHQERMRRMSHFACIEVAVRDTNPGRIRVRSGGKMTVTKRLNREDTARRDRGLTAVRNVFRSTGAREIIRGDIAIGLHLMGGCCIGSDPSRSVVSPDFHLHGHKNIFAGDSSIFPNAPGINPSLTIMALSLKAAEEIVKQVRS